jgi:hypothetical protein
MKHVILTTAQADLGQGFDFYEEQAPGVGTYCQACEMDYTSLSPSEGERARVRGGAEAMNAEFVNVSAAFPPHPNPLPLRGGEGVGCAPLLVLSSFPRAPQ